MAIYFSPSRCHYKPLAFVFLLSPLLLYSFLFTVNYYNFQRNKTIIYIVTPTYARSTQMADMTRLSQTLRLVPDIHWVVVEDGEALSDKIIQLLNRSRVNYTHLASPTPVNRRFTSKFGKGTASRRKAMDWIRENANDGVLYFADDDNSYDIRVFEEMRSTVKVSVWPVGLINKYGVSSPIISNGEVIGFHDPWISNRVFPMDMAGFAVSIELLKHNSNATMDYRTSYLEDSFLKSLHVNRTDLEPKANNCTEVLVWHSVTWMNVYPNQKYLEKEKNYAETNLVRLYKNIIDGKPS